MGGYTFWCLVVLLTACKGAGSSPSPGEYSGRDYSSYYPCKNIQCKNGGYCESKSTTAAYCVCQAGYSGSSCQHKTGLTLSIENIRCNTTCATATSCRICQQCDSCGLEPLCLTYDALINDLDTECHAQGYEEAILVKTSKSPIGYTKMTCGSLGMTYECPIGSACLSDGRGGGVCCRSSVGIDYIRNKPGSCPPSLSAQYCGTQSCRADIDCAGNLKCCQQCGNRCTNPYTDPCQNTRCNNGGRCTLRGLQVTCECPQGFSGQYCDVRQGSYNLCLNSRCINGGRCNANGLVPSCECPQGFIGQYCEVRQDNCLNSKCFNGGLCEPNGLISSCKCLPGYSGQYCEIIQDPCSNSRCVNGGRCQFSGLVSSCQCPQGYIGQYCESRQDPCSNSRCINGGRCQPNGLVSSCQCPQGYIGQYCESRQDPCSNSRCVNGGRCQFNGLVSSCQCPQGYIGQYCESRQDPCYNSRCVNGGRCHLTIGQVTTCQCPQGYIGQFCQSRQDPCSNSRCVNGGLCQAIGLVSSCQCPQGYIGQYCESRQDPCSNSRCVNGGRCQANGLVSSYPCSNSRCINGGRCQANGLVSSCQCPQGYIGQYCESRQDPCSNYRCENGAQCLAIGDRQFCQCQQGYTGYRCESRIDTRDYPYGSCNSTCSTKSSCRVCLTCDTCRAESLCLDNTKLVKDLDRECQACGYLEALLVSSTQSPVGYSPLRCKSSSSCPLGSACVEDGRGSGTCCRNKVGPNYLDNKPGSCPTVTALTCGGIACQRDSDCAGNLKCCRSCGNQCVSPVLPLADVCSSCPRGTICATVDKCLSGSGACQEQARPRCVTDSCGGCSSGEKCKVVFDDRLCRNYGDCDSYVYKCVPVQTNTCTSSCGVGTACAAVGKCCVVQAGNNQQCDNLYRCQNVRQCSQCRDGLFCRDTAVTCVGSQCPQSYECIDPCGGCSAGTVCRLNGIQGVNRYECVSQQPCGGCSSGLVCKDVQTVCDGNYCVKQQCVAPKDDKCGGCPNGLSCKYISTGCPTTQCSPPTYRCVSETITEGQCPYVPQSYSLQNIYCKSLTSGLKCNSDNDCQSDNDKCCPDSCGQRVCKRCYWKRK